MMTDVGSKAIDSEPSLEAANPGSRIELSRRRFLQLLGTGLLFTVTDEQVSFGQRRSRNRAPITVAARLHLNTDGTFTVMTGKVEEGQGSRAQLTQAAAEELQVSVDKVHLVMADTALVPDDGITAGSRTTPYTVPAVRKGAATARELLKQLAAETWQVEAKVLEVRNGTITDKATKQAIGYADLARAGKVAEAFKQPVASDVTVMAVDEWDVMGNSVPRPNLRDLVTGAHRFPSDIIRPNMLYGRVLRPPSYDATLESIDLSKARAMQNVLVVRDGSFVGCAAPTIRQASQAVAALGRSAKWKTTTHLSSKDLFTHMKKHARRNQSRPRTRGSIEEGFSAADKVLNANYEAAFIQHVPMEPRAAVAEWQGDKLTVWAGVDWPQRAQRDLARLFDIPTERIRVLVPDMGGGFGGKHSAEATEEAARLAKATGRPVSVCWTRGEEFTWAYFRPAGVMECKAGLDTKGKITAWRFVTINPGGSAMDTPYAIANTSVASIRTDAPLRQGPYRSLGATVNNFARESFMDELAYAVGVDPLAFRMAHLDNPRIRKVLETAARKFDWPARRKKVSPEIGVGLACGTEKNSCVAACVEVRIDRDRGVIRVHEVSEAFECGPIQNPTNLESQVQGCIVMGLGGAMSEAIEFNEGRILNDNFGGYRVPRFRDLPKIDVHLVDNRDIPSAGGGETPIIAVAPAIGNAVFAATGVRLRSMPMRDGKLNRG